MCTVIFEVADSPEIPVRVLAVRDEMPDRAWDPPGEWWPETHPGVVGVRDRLAGGAWLAANKHALSVILNRPERVADLVPEEELPLGSRGAIVLSSIAGSETPNNPHTESFNLVEIKNGEARVTYWNGSKVTSVNLEPGVHMIAHSSVDDMQSARINKWLPHFQRISGLPEDTWRDAWLEVLRKSVELPAHDDRAIIRDNTSHGYPTKSLLICLAEVGDSRVHLESAVLENAAHWSGESFSITDLM